MYAIYLDQAHWGKGMGRELLNDSVSLLASKGYDSITLWVLEENLHARKFYERAGFGYDGTSKNIKLDDKYMNKFRYIKQLIS